MLVGHGGRASKIKGLGACPQKKFWDYIIVNRGYYGLHLLERREAFSKLELSASCNTMLINSYERMLS